MGCKGLGFRGLGFKEFRVLGFRGLGLRVQGDVCLEELKACRLDFRVAPAGAGPRVSLNPADGGEGELYKGLGTLTLNPKP